MNRSLRQMIFGIAARGGVLLGGTAGRQERVRVLHPSDNRPRAVCNGRATITLGLDGLASRGSAASRYYMSEPCPPHQHNDARHSKVENWKAVYSSSAVVAYCSLLRISFGPKAISVCHCWNGRRMM
ncbi:hypothetical protein Trydic_g8254 [Trypoxylus dichotomus]